MCVCVCPSIWYKEYGLSYRGDRWYVYNRLFALYTISNYRACVCHRLWICVWKTECVHALLFVCYRWCRRVTGLYQSYTICSLPSSVSQLNLTPCSFCSLFFFWEVVQYKSKLVLSTVYWSCNTVQINTLVLFTNQTCSYKLQPQKPNLRESQHWLWWQSTEDGSVGIMWWHHRKNSSADWLTCFRWTKVV